MNNDRKLLELAAKAAGLLENTFMLDDDWNPIYDEQKGFYLGWGKGIWNPLTDDGDALRLAVKLGLTIEQWLDAKNVYVGFRGKSYTNEKHSIDPYAATRRAIVRAAAEIGKDMK
jgi:hypothetical protein